MPAIARLFKENFRDYGVRKVWRQLKREGHDLARCTVARLMRGMGLQGLIRDKPVRTTIGDRAAPCPPDYVNRQFKAPRPNALWVSDFIYVAAWSGFAYVAFIADAYAKSGERHDQDAHRGSARPRTFRPSIAKRPPASSCGSSNRTLFEIVVT